MNLQVNKGLCSNCNTKCVLNTIRGYTECHYCGKVNEKIIEINSESSQFNGEDFNQFSTSGTVDSLIPKSSMGSYLVGKGYNSAKRLQMWGRVPTQERSLLLVFEKIKQALSIISVDYTNIYNDAKIIYYQLYNRDTTEYTKKNVISRGKIRDGLIAYIVLLAAQNNGIVLQKETLFKMFNIDASIFKSGKKKYNVLLLKQTTTNDCKYDLNHYLERFVKCIDLNADDKEIVMVICNRITTLNVLKHKHPVASSAGILNFIGVSIPHLSKTLNKQLISNITEKSIPIIVKITNELLLKKKYLIPLEFAEIQTN